MGPWLVAVNGDNDDCYGARQTEEGKLGPWQTLKDWGFGTVHHGNGNVLLGDVAFNVGISGYTRRIRARADGVSKWEFPVPGDKIDPRDGRPREMVWGTAAALVLGGRTFLYYLAGFEYKGGAGRNPSDLDCVYVAESPRPGELQAWKPATPLPYPAMGARGAGWGDRVYLLGGSTKFVPPVRRHDEILSAKANPDGTLGAWKQVGRLPQAMEGMIVFVHEDWLYVLGGEANKSLAECWRAKLGKDGAVGPWMPQAPLPKPCAHGAYGLIGRTVYVIGEPERGGESPVFIGRL